MPGLINVHPFERLALPKGGEADIDVEMVPLVHALWSRGLTTLACCQNLGESIDPHGIRGAQGVRHTDYLAGQAWLKLPTDDATTLLNLLVQHPPFDERITRWTHRDAWENYAYLLPGEQGVVGVAPTANLHFPVRQIAEVTAILRDE